MIDILEIKTIQLVIIMLIIFLPVIISLMIARSTNFLFAFAWYCLLTTTFCFIVDKFVKIEDVSVGFFYGFNSLKFNVNLFDILKEKLKLQGEIFYKEWFNAAFFFALMLILSIPTAIIKKIRKNK